MFRAFSKFLFRLMGWKCANNFDSAPPKYIIAVAPHTSNWDFIIGVLSRSILKITNAKYLGKKELFDSFFGFFFKWTGGYPVDRSKSKNMVDAVVDIFNSKDAFAIALAPEGTRKKVEKIRTGFYYIAKGANIPIILVGFDYATKTVVVKDAFYPTEDENKDFEYIMRFFKSITGKFPEKGVS